MESSEMIIFKCTECGKSLKVSGEYVGKKVKCPVCEAEQEVPKKSEMPIATVVESYRESRFWEEGLLRFLGPTILTIMIILGVGSLTFAILILASNAARGMWWVSIPMFFNFLVSPIEGLLVLAFCKSFLRISERIGKLQVSANRGIPLSSG